VPFEATRTRRPNRSPNLRGHVCRADREKLGAEVTGVCSTRNVELVASLGADHVIDYAREDFTRGDRRYDVILDNVLNHPPKHARALAPAESSSRSALARRYWHPMRPCSRS
jgi:hypothetical protein